MTMEPKDLYTKYEYIWEQQHNSLDSIYSYIQKHKIEMDDAGNITVTNTDKKDVPAFCCHLDTVHRGAPLPELMMDNILMSMNEYGIGGDDKCGIVACLELINSDLPCKVIFFREEERGCLGSRQYNTKTLKDNLFLIEIDRKNAGDLIFKSGGTTLCDKKFRKEVQKYFPHGKDETGLYTDVNVLGDAGINMMNLSAGYYRPHTPKEYVVLSELLRNIECLMAFAKEYKENRKYERKLESYGKIGGYLTSTQTKSTAGEYPLGGGLYDNQEWKESNRMCEEGEYATDEQIQAWLKKNHY